MNHMVRALAAGVAAAGTGGATPLGWRIAMPAVCAVLLAVAAGFLVAAVYMALAQAVTPASAAAITGGGMIVLAGIVALAWWIARRMARSRRQPETTANPDLMALLTDEIRDHPQSAALAALAAGVAVGANPEMAGQGLQMVVRALEPDGTDEGGAS